MSNGNGKGGNLLEALKTILMSPVGGWAIAIGVVCAVGWGQMKDRQHVYDELLRFRTQTIPIVMSMKATAEESNAILKEVRSYMTIKKRMHEEKADEGDVSQ